MAVCDTVRNMNEQGDGTIERVAEASDVLSDDAYMDECAMRAMQALIPLCDAPSMLPIGLRDSETIVRRAGIISRNMLAARKERRTKCSQCGQPFAAAACGPTHAQIAYEQGRG